MKQFTCIGLIIFTFYCIGCNELADEYETREWISYHWVDEYFESEDISLKSSNENIYVEFIPKVYYPSAELYDLFSEAKNKRRVYKVSDIATFNTIAARNSDIYHAHSFYYSALVGASKFEDINYNSALANNIIKIEITSDTDFDANHPKGTLLNDITILQITSYGKLIKDKSVQPHIEYWNCGNQCNYTIKSLSDVGKDDLTVVENYFTLSLSPAKYGKIHNITVTITMDDGEVYSDTVEVKF